MEGLYCSSLSQSSEISCDAGWLYGLGVSQSQTNSDNGRWIGGLSWKHLQWEYDTSTLSRPMFPKIWTCDLYNIPVVQTKGCSLYERIISCRTNCEATLPKKQYIIQELHFAIVALEDICDFKDILRASISGAASELGNLGHLSLHRSHSWGF